jgi:hypothetical protein
MIGSLFGAPTLHVGECPCRRAGSSTTRHGSPHPIVAACDIRMLSDGLHAVADVAVLVASHTVCQGAS